MCIYAYNITTYGNICVKYGYIGILTLGITNGSYSFPPGYTCPRSPHHTHPIASVSYSTFYIQLIQQCIQVNYKLRPTAASVHQQCSQQLKSLKIV